MKSHEQDLLPVCECVLLDAFAKCTTDSVNMARDLTKIRSRVTHEGLSFLTISLPNFGRDFERCLEQSKVTTADFSGWKKRLCLPAFLQGFTRLVFDVETGGLLDDPNIAAIEGIRQIAYTFKKLSLPCTPEREQLAVSGYQEVERFLKESVPTGDSHLFYQVSDLLWGNVFAESYDSSRFIPKHGPGQTAERIVGNQKYANRVWYERLEPFFPSDSFLMSCVEQFSDGVDGLDSVQYVPSEDELPVKVSLVPKTLKGPRIIAMEPVCMQYAQQALARYLIDTIETSEYTAGHINFSDQSVNRRLALSASSDRFYATLDLSEASDRVPLSEVSAMLRSRVDLRDAIIACRSKAARLPSGEILPLSKFASMGSALCFPIEAMYFYTLVVTALLERRRLPVTLRNIKIVSRDVYVYGDDIIVPVGEVDIVLRTLTSFYCKVNVHKSFWNGKFRESCGMDAFDGEDVTPTYLRKVCPQSKSSVSELVSWTATSNLFYLRGYWKTASYLKDKVERLIGKLPIVLDTSPGIGWSSFQLDYQVDRWNPNLCRPEVSTYIVSPVYRKDEIGGWSALMKFFLNSERRGDAPSQTDDREHLLRSSRSGTFALKRRKVTPF